MPSQFQLRGHSLESLRWQLFDTYGSRARIIRAERVQTGGLFGLGAITSFEVTVEVDGRPASNDDDPAPRGLSRERGSRGRPSTRRGLANLLADADDADRVIAPRQKTVSTQKPDFDAILDRMTERIGAVAPGESVAGRVADLVAEPDGAGAAMPGGDPDVPRPSTQPGDLIVLVGLRDQPLRTAWSMMRALESGAELRTAGDYRQEGFDHVIIDSGEVKKVQALAAVDGKPLLIAFSIGQRRSSNPSILSSVRPDQVWLVVDAAHKPADTQAWVRQASWFSVPEALAVLGSADTATPETVNELGYPVGWVDGYQATSPVL
ncbi:hypothetical protein [Specibacter sp. RAF43]|uniref:hypothetical protein n=1 Tax=Specibacter sp. RAF43 TaxID=3233057 RepID=UPI003F99426F